jgi:S-adenosylmethionine hydrolase
VTRVARVYAEVGVGELLALVGSSGHLEIAVRDGNAAEALGVRLGDEVLVRLVGAW